MTFSFRHSLPFASAASHQRTDAAIPRRMADTNRLDRFRRVLASATRAIAKDSDADVTPASAAPDSLALKLRLHDSEVNGRLVPVDSDARAVFDALETARVEALGGRSMGGVRTNLARLAEARVRGDAITRARSFEEVPLAT